MSMNDAAVDDDYVVKLPNGDARVMNLEELDAAFDAGKIQADSPVLAPGTVTWTTLGVLAGLDDVAAPLPPASAPLPLASAPLSSPYESPSSMAPMAFTPSSRDDLGVDVALDDDDGTGLVPRRRAAKVVGAIFGAVAILAVGFAIKGAIGQALATRAGEAALAAQPPSPPPPAPVALPAPSPSPVVTAAPPPSTSAAAPAAAAPASAKAPAADKDKKKGKLPGAPAAKKKK
jgi:hypothetical protein